MNAPKDALSVAQAPVSVGPKARGILFSAPMVRAILEGRKTVTRRTLKYRGNVDYAADASIDRFDGFDDGTWEPTGSCGMANDLREAKGPSIVCPYGKPGDRLWVRETWHPCDGGPIFAADFDCDNAKEMAGVERWYPAIHLRQVDSRITLEVLSVRVERLWWITEEDARAEGVTPFRKDHEGDCWTDGTHRSAFEFLWNELNGWDPNSWGANPWVWRVEFRRIGGANA